MLSGHTWSTVTQVNQATPILLISMAFVVIVVLRLFFYEQLTKMGFTLSSNDIEVDENLPNFFNAVKLGDADWLVSENKYMRERYGFNFVTKRVEDRLDEWQVAKKPIVGIAWYHLLANPAYVRAFNYIEVGVPEREDLIVDGDAEEGNDCEQSDMVQILVNLAGVRTSVGENFRFEPGYSNTFLEAQNRAHEFARQKNQASRKA